MAMTKNRQRTVQPIGLLVNELVTNAAKHGDKWDNMGAG
jgi:two-component sensor histidine kinase